MIVRLGYVSICKTLEDTTHFKTINYTNYSKYDSFFGLEKIDEVIKHNLDTLEKIIDYNIKNNIHFYRITSSLIPLATLSDVSFDYVWKYKDMYERIGKKIENSNLRVDMHPSSYTILNTVRPQVLMNTIEELKYHEKVLNALNIKRPFLVLHVGSNAFGKKASITRFINNFNKLPLSIRGMIGIENDDKVFNVEDVLELCKVLDCPMVLDVHHDFCNKSSKDLEFYFSDIVNTWKDKVCKVHFSSPKGNNPKDIRSHHEYIDVNSFISFLEMAKKYTDCLDVMIEAKSKDIALFRLVRQLKYLTNYEFLDDTTFIVKKEP